MKSNNTSSPQPSNEPRHQDPSQLTQELNLNNFQFDYHQSENHPKINNTQNRSNFESGQIHEGQDSLQYQEDAEHSNSIMTFHERDPEYKSKIKKICIYGIIVAILTLFYMLLQIVLGSSFKKKTYFIVMILSVAEIFAYSILLYKKTKKPTFGALKIVYRNCFDFILVFLLISLLFSFANLLLSRLWYLVVSEIFNTIPIFFMRIIVHVCLRPKECER